MKFHFAKSAAAAASFLLLLFIAASCSVETEIEIRDDASGRAEITVTLHPVSVMYMTDIMTTLGGPEETGTAGPFDIDSIRRSFEARPGVELEDITAVDGETLHLTVGFDDVRTLLALPPDTAPRSDENPVTFITNTDGRTLDFRISRSNFYRISSLFVLPESPVTVLLPYSETDFMQTDEYLDVLTYALEDYLGDVSADEFMSAAKVHAAVSTEGELTGVTGGEIEDGTAVFDVPLIEILTLEEEIGYSLHWK